MVFIEKFHHLANFYLSGNWIRITSVGRRDARQGSKTHAAPCDGQPRQFERTRHGGA